MFRMCVFVGVKGQKEEGHLEETRTGSLQCRENAVEKTYPLLSGILVAFETWTGYIMTRICRI